MAKIRYITYQFDSGSEIECGLRIPNAFDSLAQGAETVTFRAYDVNDNVVLSDTKSFDKIASLPNVDDLIFAYKCEDTSGDIINEVGVNGTAFGSLQRGVTGKIDNGYYFNGTNAYIDTNQSLNITGKTYTLSAWIKKDNAGDTVEVLNQRDNNNAGIRFFIEGNKVRFTYFGVAGYQSADVTALNNTNWNHIVWVAVPSDMIYMYVNGNLVYQTSISAGSATSTNAIIGAFFDSSGSVSSYTEATKDEIYLWDVDLRDKVSDLYNDGNGITI